MSNDKLAEAAKALLAACDTSVYMNDYCGLEVSKHDAAGVNEAIEGLRKALEAAPAVEPVAWLNYKVTLDERGDEAKRTAELDFKRLAYGYVWSDAVPLVRMLAAPAAPAEPVHPEFKRGYELAIDDIKEARESEFPMVVRWATSRARVWVVFEDGAEEVEFVAAPAAPAPVDTDWQAVAKVQSAKLAVAMNEPGAAERLRAVMRSPDWKPTPVAEPADSTNPVVEPKAAISSDKWREAVDQELVVCGMTADNFPTPQAAIRGLIDWHCAVQIDPAVSSSARALIEPLIHIANIAHSGGLANMTENEALIAIRRLSLASWDRAGGAGAHGNVLAALRAAAAMREE